MKKTWGYVIIVIVVLVVSAIFLRPSSKTVSGDCGKFSTKDGYTGCMSITKGKEKKCKFKVENKINQATQQMEFNYLCLEK